MALLQNIQAHGEQLAVRVICPAVRRAANVIHFLRFIPKDIQESCCPELALVIVNGFDQVAVIIVLERPVLDFFSIVAGVNVIHSITLEIIVLAPDRDAVHAPPLNGSRKADTKFITDRGGRKNGARQQNVKHDFLGMGHFSVTLMDAYYRQTPILRRQMPAFGRTLTPVAAARATSSADRVLKSAAVLLEKKWPCVKSVC